MRHKRALDRIRHSAAAPWVSWLLLLSFSRLVVTSSAAAPSWWNTRGAVAANGTPSPNAVVNQGQLKQFTVKAVQELNDKLSSVGGAGVPLNNLVSGWQQDYATNHYSTDPNNPARPYKPADFDAVTVGQLKYIAGLINQRLQAVGYLPALPPWLRTNSQTDSSLAVLGQLKTVFNFDLAPNSDGLPDWWEQYYFGTLDVDPNAMAPNGAGMTILQAYQQGINPLDFYNGQTPALSIVGGDGQTGGAGGFLPGALMVQVLVAGQPAANAPVSFTVTQNGGQVQATMSSVPSTTVKVKTNTSGVARTFFILPETVRTTCQVVATTGTGNNQQTITFTETAGDEYAAFHATASSVSNVISTLNADGSELLTWNNNTDDPIPIWNTAPGGGWTLITTVPAGTTSYLFPKP